MIAGSTMLPSGGKGIGEEVIDVEKMLNEKNDGKEVAKQLN